MTGIPVSKTIAFGTDGVRGHAELFPFTPDALVAFGRAIALWAQKRYQKKQPKILIGMDTRISGPRIKQSLSQGLLQEGVQLLDAEVLPTPGVCQLIFFDQSFDAGIVISASHNPYQDNGIKIFDARRCKINRDDEKSILENFEWCFEQSQVPGTAARTAVAFTDALSLYQQKLQSLFERDFLKNVKVVLDCAHGATYQAAPALFSYFGASVITIGALPNGVNINDHCGALHPEGLIEAVTQHNADYGFAFDGDGDRIVAVNRYGQVKDGDDIVALLLQLPEYAATKTVVGTIMSNCGFEHVLKQQGKTLVRTNVGDKYVVAAMDEQGLPLGGEVSGHIIVKDYLSTGDGIFVALKVLQSVIMHKNWDLKTFDKFPQVMVNVPVAHKKDLGLSPFAQIIATYQEQLGGGRLVVRYSGTEHVLRVMAEAEKHELAHTIAHGLAHTLQETLKTCL